MTERATRFRQTPERTARNRLALETDHLVEDLDVRATRGGLVLLWAQIVRSLIALAGLAVLARLLAPEDFGLIAIAGTITAFLEMFADLGLSTATVQREKIEQDTVSGLLAFNIIVGFVLMLLAWLSAPLLAWFFQDERVLWLTVAASATLPVTAAAAQHNAIMARGMRWGVLQSASIVAQLVGVMVGIALAAWANLNYWALIGSTWTTSLVTVVLAWTLCPWRPSPVSSWSGARSALRFGGYLTGFAVLNYFHRQADKMIVGRSLGAEQLGFYSRAYSLFLLPINALAGPVMVAVAPAMYRLQSAPERMARLYCIAITPIVVINSGASLVLYFSASTVVQLFYGPGWDRSAAIFQALALAIMFQPIYTSVGHFFLAFGRTRAKFLAAIPATVIYLSCFTVGASWGAEGVAYGYVVGMFMVLPWWIVLSVRGTGITVSSIVRAPLLAIGAAMLSAVITMAAAGPVGPEAQSAVALVLFTMTILAVAARDEEFRGLLAGARVAMQRATCPRRDDQARFGDGAG